MENAIANIDQGGKNWKAEAQAMEDARAVTVHFPEIAAQYVSRVTPLLVKQAQNLRSNIAKNALMALYDLVIYCRRALVCTDLDLSTPSLSPYPFLLASVLSILTRREEFGDEKEKGTVQLSWK